MDYKDYYAALGIAKDATKDQVQKAYRKMARKFHPDINKSPDAETRFKEINEAYQVLSDPEKRDKYDRFGSAWKQAQGGGSPPPDFEDIFSQFGGSPGGGFHASSGGFGGEGFSSFFEALFGGMGGAPRSGPFQWSGRGPSSQAGTDHEARITISLEEAARGGSRELTTSDPMSGSHKTLRVTLPKGIQSGQKIRLSGQGGQGLGQGPRGDLYLVVDVAPDPRFRLEGRDLHTTVEVEPWEAALGGEAKVPTLDGTLSVKVPAGSSSGRKIRLRGKGFPQREGAPGDLYAELSIVVPDKLNDRQRRLYQELAEASTHKAKEG